MMIRKRLCMMLILLILGGCAGPLRSTNGKLLPPPDAQDNWNEKMCWQFVSPFGRGLAIGGIVSGSFLFTGVGGAVDMASTNNICKMTLNEMLPYAYAKLFTKTENTLIIERTDSHFAPMPSPRIDMEKYYVLADGTMGVRVTLSERLRESNTERAWVVINEVRLEGQNVIMVRENIGEEDALGKHRKWVFEKAGIK
ncbi:MAG: hypothetical protein A4E73_00827 [Syntrophaceae bacterium PtaU1.Bin231]|nr:MAG: hypothetical protein A4E73_00827 [Syntrophaceae bacterium PtaU1.Bin231]